MRSTGTDTALQDLNDIGTYIAADSPQAAETVVRRIVETVGHSSVLTVSDITGFAREGGIIGFFVEEKRVQFEINVAAAEVAGVRISSRLLNLARIVDRPKGGSSGR